MYARQGLCVWLQWLCVQQVTINPAVFIGYGVLCFVIGAVVLPGAIWIADKIFPPTD